MTIYEKYIPGKLNYITYYFLVGTIVIIIIEQLFSLWGKADFRLFRILLNYWNFTIIPIVLVYFSHQFQNTLDKTKSFLLPPDSNDYQAWVDKKTDEIFSFKFWPAKISVLTLGLGLWITVLLFPKLYPTLLPNIAIYLIILLAALMGSHGVYFVYSSLYFLSYFVQYPISVPFFMVQNQEIKYIQNFYFRTAMIVLFCYFYLLFIVLLYPFPLSELALFWLSFLGFCPLLLFLLSYLQIHVLMQRIKQSFIDICSSKIQTAIKELENGLTTDAVDKLSKLMETQSKVEKLPEWPINIGSSITFFVTLGLPVANFILAIVTIK